LSVELSLQYNFILGQNETPHFRLQWWNWII